MTKLSRRLYLQLQASMIAGAVLALRTPPAVAALAVPTPKDERGLFPLEFPFEFASEEKPNGRHLEDSR